MADILTTNKPTLPTLAAPTAPGGVLRPTYTLPSDVVAATAALGTGAGLLAPPAKLQRRAHSRGSTGAAQEGAAPKVASFVAKLYEIVNNAQLAALVGWNPDPKAAGFVVWDTERFSLQVLPRYYKHSNFHSFVRQLNNYGFHKIDAKRGDAYEHRCFVRGRADLLACITRKLPQASSAASSSELSGSEDDSSCALDALFAEARDELGSPVPTTGSLGPGLARRTVRHHQHCQQPPSPSAPLLPSPSPRPSPRPSSVPAPAMLLGARAAVSDSERGPADLSAAAAFRQPLGIAALPLLPRAPGGSGVGAPATLADVLAAVVRVECETDRLHGEVARLRADMEAARQREQALSATTHEVLCTLQQVLQRLPKPAPDTGVSAVVAAAEAAVNVNAATAPAKAAEDTQSAQLPPLLNKNDRMAVTNFCTS